ncbi:holo-ACP synthase [Lapidilactobacillus wuchangensis]|uniref:holo-ACP synthase n=1 Tax=Lapidilactobacillus wuchangensis TaxID=2486001 RepID=UPI000F7B84F5|nr:holo-ACP synthase [Lapidilactobacillus wuchangensis]
MIYGVGIDLTEIARIRQAVAHNPRFVDKVLTPAEIAAYQQLTGPRQWEFLAGRFSAKESYSKAYGTGLGRVGLLDVTVLNDELGKPVVTAHPYPGRALVSISHTATLVMTEVILEEKEKGRD